MLLIELLGELQQAGQGLLDLSPYAHVPRLLLGQGPAVALIWLVAIAAALVAAGLAGLERREIG